MANVLVAQLLCLNSMDKKQLIHLYIILIAWGYAYEGLAIRDTLQMIQALFISCDRFYWQNRNGLTLLA
jgi:ATP-dependent protease ClpP protease subunit